MPLPKLFKRFFRYPLMWVMLLWAVTSPGQEEAVYRFLVNGSTTGSGEATAPVADNQSITAAESAVSWDAQHASYLHLQAGPAALQLLQFFCLSPHVNTHTGNHTLAVAVSLQLAELLLYSLFPNAP
ncbi:hypothetical protein [Pontibacter sp. H249]|uniref:hypothetical protein n=1 Tax=Pontibacter sp. H249 TaxID=3133420 RepID=UPI0030BD7C31